MALAEPISIDENGQQFEELFGGRVFDRINIRQKPLSLGATAPLAPTKTGNSADLVLDALDGVMTYLRPKVMRSAVPAF